MDAYEMVATRGSCNDNVILPVEQLHIEESSAFLPSRSQFTVSPMVGSTHLYKHDSHGQNCLV